MCTRAVAVVFVILLLRPTLLNAQDVRKNAAPASAPAAAGPRMLATKFYVACSEFAVDIYHNGSPISVEERRLIKDVSGSTLEEVNVAVHEGDWLVFHVVQNRLRRGGARYFAVAGMKEGRTPAFVSDSRSGQWFTCDDAAKAEAFVLTPDTHATDRAKRIEKPWDGGDALLSDRVAWKGEPIWGDAHETWIKFVAPPVDPAAIAARENAPGVVFIGDATGTMLGLKFELQRKQLLAAIEALPPGSKFNVIFFRGGDSDKEWALSFSTSLRGVGDTGLQDARQFIEKTEVLGKGTNPLPALRLAFAQRPQKIYFLTDGQFDNVVSYEQVLAEVARLNRGKRVELNTIAFMSEDKKAEGVLERLARDNGGRFRKVSEKDLKDGSPF